MYSLLRACRLLLNGRRIFDRQFEVVKQMVFDDVFIREDGWQNQR